MGLRRPGHQLRYRGGRGRHRWAQRQAPPLSTDGLARFLRAGIARENLHGSASVGLPAAPAAPDPQAGRHLPPAPRWSAPARAATALLTRPSALLIRPSALLTRPSSLPEPVEAPSPGPGATAEAEAGTDPGTGPETGPATPSEAAAKDAGEAAKPRYWPGIDGLRALAVAAVVAYHMDSRWVPGGFFGVDLFFVISGYLITTLLAAEWRRLGRIGLGRFWLRRVRRLFPAVVALVVVLIAVAAVVAPDALGSMRLTVPSALVYMTNWWFVFHHVGYFQSLGRPPLLLHFWSLAIEEQYYLIWPPLLALMLVRWRRPARIAAVALAGAAASSMLMALLYHPGLGIDRVYYGSDTHSQGLLLGSALALLLPATAMPERIGAGARRAMDAAGLAALAALVALMLVLNEAMAFTWRFGFVLVVAVAGVSVLVAAHPASRLGRALGVAPLRWLGSRSYSVYLWHWPILELTRPDQDIALRGAPLVVLRLALIAGAAELSYRLVEQPWRRGQVQRAIRRLWSQGGSGRGLALGAAGAAACTLVVALVAAGAPAPSAPLGATATAAAEQPASGSGSSAAAAGSAAGHRAAHRGAAVPGHRRAPAPAGGSPPATAAPAGTTTAFTAPPTTSPTTTPTTSAPPAAGGGGLPPLLHATPGGPVLAVGDSVMLAGSSDLQQAFGSAITVDAEEGRQVYQGLDRLAAYRAAGRLQGLRALVVDLGTNGPFTPPQFRRLVQLTEGVPHVVVVNARVPRSWEPITDATLSAGVQGHRRFSLVDWYGATAQPGLFWPDQIHPNPKGQRVYSNLIVKAVDTGP